MLAAGVIQRERTSYISPLVCVRKKDGRIRVCLDALICEFQTRTNNEHHRFSTGFLADSSIARAYKILGFVFEGETYKTVWHYRGEPSTEFYKVSEITGGGDMLLEEDRRVAFERLKDGAARRVKVDKQVWARSLLVLFRETGFW
nr:unnamed protein product [Callosobruchus chinensis]